VKNTRCHIGTVFSRDDGHIVTRNIYRKATNIFKKVCTKLVPFTRLYKDARSTKHKKELTNLTFFLTSSSFYVLKGCAIV
jgi:exopolysaccharide biosynthesis predicted pyruvyltransferase EpsI